MRTLRWLALSVSFALWCAGGSVATVSAEEGLLNPTPSDVGGTDYLTDRYGYMTDAYNWQSNWIPYDKIKSFSLKKWFDGSTAFYSVTSNIQVDVDQVVANYNSAFSYSGLQLYKTSPADVVFDENIIACGGGAAGCFDATSFVPYGDAYWPQSAAIHIDLALPPDRRRAVIAHEIGHLYGLDEGYFKNDGYVLCKKSPPSSVMDALGCEIPYPAGPYYDDSQRIQRYWSAQPVTVDAFDPSVLGTRVRWTWQSNGWNDRNVHYRALYGVPPNPPSTQYEEGWLPSADLRFRWEDWRRVFGAIVTRPQEAVPPVPNGSYQKVCFYTESLAWGGPSTERCSLDDALITYGTGPVGLWRMDEGSGTTTADSSGNNNTGTLINNPDWFAGRVGNALRFNVFGANQYVNIPSSSSVNVGAGDFSISFWIDPNNDTYCCYRLLAKANSYTVDYWNNKLRLFFLGGEAGQYMVQSSSQVALSGGWNHVVWIISRTIGPQLYVNGNLTPVAEINPGNRTANLDSANPFRFATYADEGNKYPGIMDEVRLYNRALSQAEALNLYNNPGG